MTSEEIGVSIAAHFGALPDPRRDINREHRFIDILVIAICAIVCGAEDWVTVALFGEAKARWFRSFLALPNGIPAHDTFWRVFRSLDSEQFEGCFLRWVRAVSELTQGQVVALDGKHVRRSHDRGAAKAAITLVSAWATANGLLLGQRRVGDKSSEMVAMPELLESLVLSGCLVTVDALNTQVAVAQKIVDKQADYLLALKGNHPLLHADAELLFTNLEQVRPQPAVQYARQVEKGHGRLEVREAWVLTDPHMIQALQGSEKWPQLCALVKLQAQRHLLGPLSPLSTGAAPPAQAEQQPTHQKPTEEVTEGPAVRYYLASFAITAEQAIAATRAHWQIENNCHWVLDIAFREDECRLRKDHGAHNFAILRRIALNLLKHDTTTKAGIKARRLKAGWNENYLLHLLQPLLT
jgi:predicted transposase YbfD/YdcC